jgi:hypothetical protein
VALLLTVNPTLCIPTVSALSADYKDVTYIYRLTDNGVPFYVGSTVNPVSRLMGHLSGDTRDTSERVGQILGRGDWPSMEIIDVTTRADRLTIEAVWINQTPNMVNTTRYQGHYAKWLRCPSYFKAASTRTLT